MAAKVGLDDYLNSHTAAEFEALPMTEVTDDTDDDVRAADTKRQSYFWNDKEGCLYYWKQSGDGRAYPVKLANFGAVISEDITLDDGIEKTHFFVIKGKSANRIFPAIEIPAKNFPGLVWVSDLGADAIIEPISQGKDRFRHATQVLSIGKTKMRQCFAHTGWRKINGQWAYLHAGGAIGAEGVEVRLSRELERYCLPEKPENEMEAINASLSFLDIGKLEITLPLFAAIYLAPLTTILQPMPNFSFYLYGQTGTFKSTISLLQLCHFGNFPSLAGLNNFDDSVNSIEKRGCILKDVVLILDDYHPSHRRQDAQSKESVAQRLIRSYSNRTARGRLNADASDKGRYEPRGILQITGEELTTGQSTLARVCVVEIEPDDIDKDALTAIQQKALLLPHAMCSYILWLKDRIDMIQKEFPARFAELRAAASKEGQHRKTPEQTAFMFYTLELVTRWLQEKGIFSDIQTKEFLDKSRDILIALGEKQARRIEADDPVRRFADIVNSMISAGDIRLEPVNAPNKQLGGGGASLAGYYDNQYYYLLSTPLWHAIGRFCIQEGSHFPFTKNTLYKMLAGKGFLIPDRNGENTSVLRIGAKNMRVIKISTSLFNSGDETGKVEYAYENINYL